MKFNFTDKQSYLKWRQEWRESYKELSAEIRQLKRCRKQFFHTYEKVPTEHGPVRILIAKTANPENRPVPQLPSFQAAAAYQMEMLDEAKALSWAMRASSASTKRRLTQEKI